MTAGDVEWAITETGQKLIPAKYLPIYKEAGKKYGVPWNLLAAIHAQETSFSMDLSVSSAGAVGAMQFEPCSWLGWDYYKDQCDSKGDLKPGVHIDLTDPHNIHGGEGLDADGDGKADPYDPVDAINAAAKRLAADYKRTGKDWFAQGGPVWRYNPSMKYVSDVERKFHEFAQPLFTAQATAPAEGKIGELINEAKKLIGVTKYVFGANDFPYRLDCSSFTMNLYKRVFGIDIGRDTLTQVTKGVPVERNELKPGDLVFFRGTYRPGVSHVGIYIGGGEFINNQSTGKDVQIGQLNQGYWDSHYYTARRVVR
nr:NlpC/P60 family protein [Thermoactinomyces sp. CICC 10521]